MKWIGQNIYDLASRFRNDVFLEDISTGTIASGAHLGLDSNNKIVKAVDGGGDLTSIVAGTGLSGTSLTGPIPTLNVDATQPNIDSIGTDGDTLAILSDQLVMSNATASMPTVKLTNTTDDSSQSEIIFEKLRDDNGVAQGQNLGAIWFRGQDSGQNTEDYAYIIGEIDVSTHGQESGQLVLGVANHDGGNGTGLKLTGGSADDEIDVVVGSGTASTTTIAGTLSMGLTAAINSSAAWVGKDIPSAKLDPDTAHLTTDQTFTGTKTFNETIVGSINGSSATVATIAGLAPNTATTQATQPAIESIGTDGDTLSILGDRLEMISTSNGKPDILLKNQGDDGTAPIVYLINERVDGSVQAGEDFDTLGSIYFGGYDDQGTPGFSVYAIISSEIHDATSGEESGSLFLSVVNHDGGLGKGLILTGGSENNEIDVTLGLGANSVVTIPGDIDLEGDIDVNGTLETDALTIAGATIAAIGTTAITTLGTIGTGVWNGTAIAQAQIAGDAINGDKIADDAVDSEHYTDGSIDTAHIADDQVTFAKASGVTPNVYGNIIKLLPSDFATNGDGGNTKFGVGYTDSAGTGYGMRVPNNSSELYAFVSIPEGMKATEVDIFDKTNLAVEVFEVQINATTMASRGTGNANTTIDIDDVNATATNLLAIEVTTTDVANRVYGGSVTIAAQ